MIETSIEEYNFEEKSFRVKIKICIDNRSTLRNCIYSINNKDSDSSDPNLETLFIKIFINDIDQVKKWKKSTDIPPKSKARLMIVPKFIKWEYLGYGSSIRIFGFELFGIELSYNINIENSFKPTLINSFVEQQRVNWRINNKKK